MSEKAIIRIEGMTCVMCAKRVNEAIAGLSGVKGANVNFASEKATFSYDPSQVDLNGVAAAVKAAGYEAVLPKEGASPNDDSADRLARQKAIRVAWTKFIAAAVFALPLLYIAMAPMLKFVQLPLPPFLDPMTEPLAYALVELALVLPVMGVGYRFYTVGFRALFSRTPNMDSLIALGTSAAFIFSAYNLWQIASIAREPMADASGYVESLYFETSGVIITLILLGKALEALSKGRTGEAIKKLMNLAPKTAIVLGGGGADGLGEGAEREIPVSEVKPGDIVVVRPGASIPVDGKVVYGETAIDESMLTGESMPAMKGVGSGVFAATINTTGLIHFRAEKVGADTALAQIIRLVEEAQGSKAPIAKLADVVSGYFVPIVCLIALASGAAWFAGTRDLGFSLRIFISVLVIACPCALGLATPTAIMVATGKGAEKGILIKSGEALETAHKLTAVVFDKTGTITEGKPQLTDIIPTIAAPNYEANQAEKKLLVLAASAEQGSEHPLGQALVRAATERKASLHKPKGFNALSGRGIEATVDGQSILIGSRRLLEKNGVACGDFAEKADALSDSGKTVIWVSAGGELLGLLAVADVIKEDSAAAISKLKNLGIKTLMLTGDNARTARGVASEVGIDDILAEVLPEDKAEKVSELKTAHAVGMVGDGINDAPALVTADVGIAIGSGTDISIESADIVLMRSNLLDVPTLIDLSRRTIRNIKQNLFWAFGYNVIGIPIAAGLLHLFGGPLLNPMFAAAAMSLSSVSVLTNALRLRKD